MMNLSLDNLLEKHYSRYTLAVATAKRARQLVDGSEKLVDVETNKPVSIALYELNEGKIKIKNRG